MDQNLPLYEPGPTRADALQNRQLLLQTARRLFEELGVEQVSMTAVAQEAGVGKGTLYRHFENKAALCQALLDEEQRDLQTRTMHRLATLDDALDNLRWFLVEVVNYVERNRAFLCVQVPNEEVMLLGHPAHLWWRQTIYKLLQRINPLGDLSYMADVLYAMLDVHVLRFQRSTLGYNQQRIVAGLEETLFKLLR
ncbi:MAG: TetR/AcrR family transcriptional regulator [Anaerolineae bacterium]|nr:TetR/AcrR family transcriptional regulator [Anaerolineae bacterium]